MEGASLINYHNASGRQEYAVDLLKLNIFGTRARGLRPERLDCYAIYGGTLYSSCCGRVRNTVSHRPEYAPLKRDEEHPVGNHVVLRCKGVPVYLVHLMPGSLAADSGDVVVGGSLSAGLAIQAIAVSRICTYTRRELERASLSHLELTLLPQ